MRPANILWQWNNRIPHHNINPCLFKELREHHTLPLRLRYESYEAGLDTGLHQHIDFYAFYIVQAGQGIHLINNHPYTIVCGDIYVLPPHTIHAYQQFQTLEITAFYFQNQLFSSEELAALRALPGFWPLLISMNGAPSDMAEFREHRLHLTPECHRTVNDMIAEISSEYIGQSAEASLLTHSQLFRLLVHIARWRAQPGELKSDNTSHTSSRPASYSVGIANVVRFCEEHFCESLTVPQLAALLFLSPGRFSELFTLEVGISPAAYIRRLRLERAQALLRTTALSITEIAHQVGFGDGPHLARSFQSAFHLTPTAYRATFR